MVSYEHLLRGARIGLRGRIAAGFGAILVLAVGTAGFVAYNLHGLNRDFAHYRSISDEAQQVQSLNTGVARLLVLVRDQLRNPDLQRAEAIDDLLDRLGHDIKAVQASSGSAERRELLTQIAQAHGALDEGLSAMFAARRELSDLVSESMTPSIDTAVDLLNRVVYALTFEDDAKAGTDVATIIKDVLISQVVFTRFLADPTRDLALAENSLTIALNRTEDIAKRTQHMQRKSQLTEALAQLQRYYEGMARAKSLAGGLQLAHDEVLGRAEQTISSATATIVDHALADARSIGQRTAQAATWTVMATLAATVVLALLGCAIAFVIGHSIAAPVSAMTDAMRRLAGGDTSVEVPGRGQSDEIGAMASAVEVFRQNAIERERLSSESEAEMQARVRRQQAVEELIEEFRSSVGSMLETVAANTTQMQATAHTLSSIAKDTSELTVSTAGASGESSANVTTAARAAENLNAAIREIAQVVGVTTEVVGRATHAAAETNTQVSSLAEAAQKIGDVVVLIQAIAEQTNLLALNATIEAARAGEAGKGFAVVAQEVKSLANQTARATAEIGQQIGAIQSSTGEAVSNIEHIAGIMREVNRHTASIAAAVEEQGASTEEIARNVQFAAVSTQRVANDIETVQNSTGETLRSADEVLRAATMVGDETQRLRQTIDTFLARVHAA